MTSAEIEIELKAKRQIHSDLIDEREKLTDRAKAVYDEILALGKEQLRILRAELKAAGK